MYVYIYIMYVYILCICIYIYIMHVLPGLKHPQLHPMPETSYWTRCMIFLNGRTFSSL